MFWGIKQWEENMSMKIMFCVILSFKIYIYIYIFFFSSFYSKFSKRRTLDRAESDSNNTESPATFTDQLLNIIVSKNFCLVMSPARYLLHVVLFFLVFYQRIWYGAPLRMSCLSFQKNSERFTKNSKWNFLEAKETRPEQTSVLATPTTSLAQCLERCSSEVLLVRAARRR